MKSLVRLPLQYISRPSSTLQILVTAEDCNKRHRYPPYCSTSHLPFPIRLSLINNIHRRIPNPPSILSAVGVIRCFFLSSSMEKQFEDFRLQLEESGSVRDRIRSVVMEMESVIRFMQSNLLLVRQSVPLSEVLQKTSIQISLLRDLYSRLAEILRECPGQYYRYHGDWRSETQTVVSLLAFLHWLETGNLLMQTEAEQKLGLDATEFGLDIEDYLIGLCFMSSELPRYVVKSVTAGDYDCPSKVLNFLTDLYAAFRMLNLRNDFLRRKFDGLKYDLGRVEEVHYDVKIRGLLPKNSKEDQKTEA